MESRLRVLALATNVPGPLAARALAADGAQVVKVEPPHGDPLALAAPSWYEAIAGAMDVERLDLKTSGARARLEELLAESDLLVTTLRPRALERLDLAWKHLHERHPRLAHVAIFGEAEANADRAGHDLTYQAQAGLVDPPSMPRSVFADLFAAERAVAVAYRVLLQRERSGAGVRADVSIAQSAVELAQPLLHGLTSPDGPLGGALPVYRMYATRDGWIALAALEPHFQAHLREALQVSEVNAALLRERFLQETCAHWEDLARRFDLPLCAVATASCATR